MDKGENKSLTGVIKVPKYLTNEICVKDLVMKDGGEYYRPVIFCAEASSLWICGLDVRGEAAISASVLECRPAWQVWKKRTEDRVLWRVSTDRVHHGRSGTGSHYFVADGNIVRFDSGSCYGDALKSVAANKGILLSSKLIGLVFAPIEDELLRLSLIVKDA